VIRNMGFSITHVYGFVEGFWAISVFSAEI